jgi:hypothetical protein
MQRVHVLVAEDSAGSVTKNIVYHNVLHCCLFSEFIGLFFLDVY